MESIENNNQESLTPAEIAMLLSQTMKDVVERKTTLRHAVAMSRLATALAKVIEIADLKERLELLERIIVEKRKK